MTATTTKHQRRRRLTYRGPSIDELYCDYAKQRRIDSQAPITATRELMVDAPVSCVWDVLSHVEEWDQVHPRVSDVRNRDGVVEGARFGWRNGRAKLNSRFAVVDEYQELTWTGTSIGVKVVHRHVLADAGDDRTRLRTEESMAGMLAVLFFSSAKLDAALDQWLRAISNAAATCSRAANDMRSAVTPADYDAF